MKYFLFNTHQNYFETVLCFLNVYVPRADNKFPICQVTDFVERSMKHSSHGEALLLKKPLDDRLHELATHIPELNLASITELEFISNFQAIQVRSRGNINTGNATNITVPGRYRVPDCCWVIVRLHLVSY